MIDSATSPSTIESSKSNGTKKTRELGTRSEVFKSFLHWSREALIATDSLPFVLNGLEKDRKNAVRKGVFDELIKDLKRAVQVKEVTSPSMAPHLPKLPPAPEPPKTPPPPALPPVVTQAVAPPAPAPQPEPPATYTDILQATKVQGTLAMKCSQQASVVLKRLMSTDLNVLGEYPVHELQGILMDGVPKPVYFYGTADFKATFPSGDRALLQFNTRINDALIRNEDPRLVQHHDGGGVVRSSRDRNSDEGFWVRAWELLPGQPIAVKCYVYNKADGREIGRTRWFSVSVENGITELCEEEYLAQLEYLKGRMFSG